MLQRNSPDTLILQYLVETWCHVDTTTLYVTFRAKSMEITIKTLFMNVKSSAFHFQSVSETNGNWKKLRNGGGFGGWSLIPSTMLKNCIALVQRIPQNQKLILPQYRNTAIPQNPMSPSHSNVALQPRLNQEHPIEEVESKWNTSELYLKSSFGRLHPINFEFLFRNWRTLSSVVILGAVQTWIFPSQTPLVSLY